MGAPQYRGEPMTTPILTGMRIVEGSAFVAAPSATMSLALLGAEVIRFDQIGGGIDYHRWPLTSGGHSLYWAGLNKAKRSIAVDLKSDAGREIVTALITAPGQDSGIFVSNFPSSGWLGYEALSRRRGDLIMVSITGNPDGSTAVDYTVNPAVGYPNATGASNADVPTNHVLPAWDVICGQTAAVGLLAAERHRLRTGEGQHVTLALSDTAIATVSHLGHVAEAQINGTQRPRLGNDLYGAFGRDFLTSDGRRVMIVAISDRQWSNLVEATDSSEAIAGLERELRTDLFDEGQRFVHREEICRIVGPWIASHSLAEVGSRFDSLRVCWGPYQSFLELVDQDPRCSIENPMMQTVDHRGIGDHLVAGSPLAFSAVERSEIGSPPLVGQDTAQVLEEILGLSQTEIGELHDQGVVASSS